MLPGVPDSQLCKELRVVVTKGGDLPQAVHRSDSVENLLRLAAEDTAGDYKTTAEKFRSMLEDAIETQAEQRGFDDPDHLFTETQAMGLRILFGLHPDYLHATANVRRRNARTYLDADTGRRADIDIDSWTKRRQMFWMQQTVECLRRVYGQEGQPRYRTLQRYVNAFVGPDRRIESQTVVARSRSLIESFESLGYSFYTDADYHVELKPLFDVSLDAQEFAGGRLSMVIRLPRPVASGESFQWGFERIYSPRDGTTRPLTGRATIIVRDPGTEVSIDVYFRGECPDEIWLISDVSPRQLPSEPISDWYPVGRTRRLRVEPDESGAVHYPTTSETVRRRAYGIAWRWSHP